LDGNFLPQSLEGVFAELRGVFLIKKNANQMSS